MTDPLDNPEHQAEVFPPLKTIRWGELRRIVNFWRLRRHSDGALCVEFYRSRGRVVVTRIVLALEES